MNTAWEPLTHSYSSAQKGYWHLDSFLRTQCSQLFGSCPKKKRKRKKKNTPPFVKSNWELSPCVAVVFICEIYSKSFLVFFSETVSILKHTTNVFWQQNTVFPFISPFEGLKFVLVTLRPLHFEKPFEAFENIYKWIPLVFSLRPWRQHFNARPWRQHFNVRPWWQHFVNMTSFVMLLLACMLQGKLRLLRWGSLSYCSGVLSVC